MPLPNRAPMSFTSFARLHVLSVSLALALPGLAFSAPLKPSEAEQLRVVQAMSEQLRGRIARLPVALGPDQPLGETRDVTVTLNEDPVIVEGQRFDGVVFTAPGTSASFAWAFPCPPNAARWYILREKGEMKGFGDFIQRPRGALRSSETWAPTSVTKMTLQKLNAAALVPGERYVLWFNFKDAAPAAFTLRAGFFAKPSLNNNGLPTLLFPATVPET